MAAAADVILHAGDVLEQEHLDDLGRWAAVHVVRGNNDIELTGVPERVEAELAGVRIGMVHDSGRRTGRRVLELAAGEVRDARIEIIDH